MSIVTGLVSGIQSLNTSIYDYGPSWPWVENSLEDSQKVSNILTGSNGWGINNFNFKAISTYTQCSHLQLVA
jgi:hypothetical protein